MGGFSDTIASPGVQFGLEGLSTGMKTGAAIANAQYNAASARMQARAIEDQSNLQAWLIREQYATEYQVLKDQQERQLSADRVSQAKHGITGASATEVMASYAAKAQKNLEILYYNAAMRTGQESLAASAQRSALLEKARQYDWQATQSLVAGVVNMGTGFLDTYTRQIRGTNEVNPVKNLELGKPDPITQALAEFSASRTDGGNGYYLESGVFVSPLED